MKFSFGLIGLLTVIMVFLCSNSPITTNVSSGDSNSVDFRSFPPDEALRERVTKIVQRITTPEDLRKEVKPMLVSNKVISWIMAINLIGHKPFLWVYKNSKEKNITLLATKSDEKYYKNYGVLLDSWKDTLFVFGTLEVSIDSSVFDANLVKFEISNDSKDSDFLSLDRIGSSYFFKLKDDDNHSREATINLTYKSRKEKRVLHFVSEEEEKQMELALGDYLSCNFSPSEWASIFLYEFPQIKTVDRRSLESFISSLHK